MAAKCFCQCPGCQSSEHCIGIYCDENEANRSPENDYWVDDEPVRYEHINMPVPSGCKPDCQRCDVKEPHYHIISLSGKDSGPLCDGKFHKLWCKANHHFN